MKTYTKEAFIRLGVRRRMVLLTSLNEASYESSGSAASELTGDSPSLRDEDAQPSPVQESGSVDLDHEEANLEGAVDPGKVLDMGAFSQLMDSAQRSGLVPGADLIAQIRDREFRTGKYDKAYAGIEGLFSAFSSAASQRTQRLAREEQEIKNGKMKISPKDLLAKRAKDRKEDQEIERARNRFQRVLNGLQVLVSAV